MGIRHPFVPDQKMAIAIGAGLFLLGAWFLYDAWEGRGKKTPRILRPITFW